MSAIQSKTKEDNYAVEIKSGTGHTIVADEPEKVGGQNKGMSPHELISSALAACTSATLKMYAQRKEWDLKAVNTTIKFTGDGKPGDISSIQRDVELEGDLDEKQKERLLEIANKCPIHKLLAAEVEIKSALK